MGLETFLVTLGQDTINFLPNLLGALLLLLIGYVVGKIVGAIIKKLCEGLKVDRYLKTKGRKISDLFRIASEWIIYLVFIQSAVQYLGIIALAMFVNEIIYFIPKAVGAAVIIIVGYILGTFLENEIKKNGDRYGSIVGKIVNFFVLYVSVALALPFLGVNAELVNNILLIIIGSIGLGVAIAIGLGLKDIVAKEANKYIDIVEKSVGKSVSKRKK